ncbi:tRNA-queuosine alpha-mannosyltransferase domain-containing protein [Aurantivibrio plasticivorans]
MKILLLSAYTARSHQYWIDSLLNMFPNDHWTVLSLPPRYFSWRIRGNSLSWAYNERDTLEQHYDLIVATSMVDLSALRGLVPAIARIPTLVYFHENQFAYPLSSNQQGQQVEPQILNLYTALAADCVVFNSEYNRASFLDGATQLLKKLPDHVPNNLVPLIRDKSHVVAVPIRDITHPDSPQCSSATRFSIVWNHRWEYDKGVDQLLACLQKLPSELDLTFHIVGQAFRQTPKSMTNVLECLKERDWLGQCGYIENRHGYLSLLQKTHAVLSTALHDFQGLSVLEACLSGCWPIVPNRLAYREFIPESNRYFDGFGKIGRAKIQEAESAAELMTSIYAQWHRNELPRFSSPQCNAVLVDTLTPQYKALFSACLQTR